MVTAVRLLGVRAVFACGCFDPLGTIDTLPGTAPACAHGISQMALSSPPYDAIATIYFIAEVRSLNQTLSVGQTKAPGII